MDKSCTHKNEKLTNFCSTCNVPICQKCNNENHQTHPKVGLEVQLNNLEKFLHNKELKVARTKLAYVNIRKKLEGNDKGEEGKIFKEWLNSLKAAEIEDQRKKQHETIDEQSKRLEEEEKKEKILRSALLDTIQKYKSGGDIRQEFQSLNFDCTDLFLIDGLESNMRKLGNEVLNLYSSIKEKLENICLRYRGSCIKKFAAQSSVMLDQKLAKLQYSQKVEKKDFNEDQNELLIEENKKIVSLLIAMKEELKQNIKFLGMDCEVLLEKKNKSRSEYKEKKNLFKELTKSFLEVSNKKIEVTTACKELEEKKSRLEAEITQSEKKLAETKELEEEKRKEIFEERLPLLKKLYKQQSDCTKEIEKLINSRGQYEAQNEKLKDEIISNENEKAKFKVVIAKLESAINELNGKHESMLKEIEDMEKMNKKMQEQYADESQKLQGDIDMKKEEIEELKKIQGNYEKDIEKLKEEKEFYQKEVDDLINEDQMLKDKINKKQESLRAIQSTISKDYEKIEIIKTSAPNLNKSLADKIEESNKILKSFETTKEDLESKLNKLRVECNARITKAKEYPGALHKMEGAGKSPPSRK